MSAVTAPARRPATPPTATAARTACSSGSYNYTDIGTTYKQDSGTGDDQTLRLYGIPNAIVNTLSTQQVVMNLPDNGAYKTIEASFTLARNTRLRLVFDGFNLLHAYAAETINNGTGLGSGVPTFQTPTAILGPRTGRIGFRFIW